LIQSTASFPSRTSRVQSLLQNPVVSKGSVRTANQEG
jgi:hypothetical protein